jgi:uncharacterized SAM-binding protein YcdF (DUF218 family)
MGLTALSLLLAGCGSTTKPSTPKQPDWLVNPQKGYPNKLAAVGCAGIHVHGQTAQKKLAHKRAIDVIAMQKQTKVTAKHYYQKTGNSSGVVASSSKSSSLHEVEGVNIQTKILDTYKKTDQSICVWVVEQ